MTSKCGQQVLSAALLLSAIASATQPAEPAPDPGPAAVPESNQAASRCLAPLPMAEALQPGVRQHLARQRLAVLNSASAGQSGRELAAGYGSLAQLYHAHLIFAPAAACYRAALALTPNDARAHYLLGYLHQQRGEPDDAAARYRQALTQQPGLHVAALRLALILADQQHSDEARELLQATLEDEKLTTGQRAWARFQLGRLALQQEHYQQAIHWLQQALRDEASTSSSGAQPVNPQQHRSGIHYPLAMAWRGLGNREQTRRHLQRNNGHPPALPDPLLDQLAQIKTRQSEQQRHYKDAIAAIEQQDYPVAIREFSAGLATDDKQPRNPHARTSLARALYLNGERQAAVNLLQQVISDSGTPLALFLLGVCEEQRGHIAAAERRYREVLAMQPTHAGAHFLLADLLLRRQAYQDAAHHYQQAWQRQPDNHSARLREIIAQAALGKAEPALLTGLQQAAHDFPADPASRYYLARLLTLATRPEIRDTGAALQLAQTLYAQFPGPNQAELLALTHAANGHFDDALRWLQPAIDAATRYHPDSLPALHRLQDRYREHQPSNEMPFPLPPSLPSIDSERIFRSYPSNTPY